MKLYEIDNAIDELIRNSVDPETGEVVDITDELDALQMEREDKLESVALVIKNLTAEATAIRNEEKALADRRRTAENRVEWLKGYLMQSLAGQKFSTPKVAVSFRNSTSTFIENEEMFLVHYPQFARVKTELDRSALKDALKNGEHFEGACLENRTSMIVR